jgi:hypothetical protein
MKSGRVVPVHRANGGTEGGQVALVEDGFNELAGSEDIIW